MLWPQVVKAVAPVPVLAAGGIGSGQQIAAALALGAQGAWTGSQWLMVEEAENTADPAGRLRQGEQPRHRAQPFVHRQAVPHAAQRLDRGVGEPREPRSRCGMPLQYMVSGMAVAATHQYPDESVDVAFNPVGQVVGQFKKVEKTATVIERWVQEYLEATSALDALNEAAAH